MSLCVTVTARDKTKTPAWQGSGDVVGVRFALGAPRGRVLWMVLRESLLLAAAGLAVVLDVVYNHLGPAGNYLAEFGPYFTDRYRTPWGDALNVDGYTYDFRNGNDRMPYLVHGIDMNNPALWTLAEGLGMPLAPHTGNLSNGMMARLRPSFLATIAAKHPKLYVVGAHFGNPWYDEAGEAARRNKNLYFDLSGSSLIKKENDPALKETGWEKEVKTESSKLKS